MLYLLDMKSPVNGDKESNAINFVRVLFEVVRYLDVMQKRDVLCWLRLHHLVASQGGTPLNGGRLHYGRQHFHLIGRKSGQALARVRFGGPTFFGCHCCLP